MSEGRLGAAKQHDRPFVKRVAEFQEVTSLLSHLAFDNSVTRAESKDLVADILEIINNWKRVDGPDGAPDTLEEER